MNQAPSPRVWKPFGIVVEIPLRTADYPGPVEIAPPIEKKNDGCEP